MKLLDFIVKENEEKKIDKLKKILEGLPTNIKYFEQLKVAYLEFSPHTFILIYFSILLEPNMRMSIYYGHETALYKVLPRELTTFILQYDDEAVVEKMNKGIGILSMRDTSLLFEILRFESMLDKESWQGN